MERAVFEWMAELDQEHWWFLARRRIVDRLIARVVRPPEGARVLEIGCGTGHNLAMLGRFGRVDACELDPDARAIASKRLGRMVKDAMLPDLSMFPPDRFDVIVLADVLEHVKQDTAALSAIHGRLKPGGALLLTVPANKWMWSAHDVAVHHHRRYSKRQLARVIRAAGFDVQLLSHFNSLLFPLIAGARAVAKLIGREMAEDRQPSAPVNAVLNWVFGLEADLIGRMPMPFGVSLVAVVRRPAAY
jgi:SAM-dependent methyltransferase